MLNILSTKAISHIVQLVLIVILSFLLIPYAHAAEGIEELNESLLESANTGDLEKFKMLLNKGADINAKDFVGKTAMTNSLANRHFNLSKFIIEKGADVNTSGINGYSPIYVAVTVNNTKIVEMLLDRGADANATMDASLPVLMLAIKNNNSDIVKALIIKGADVNMQSFSESGYGQDAKAQTPLMLARKKGNKAIIELLVKAGAK